MSGVGITELLLLFVIGLLILGPERLPRVATQIGRWVGRARRTANQLRYQLEREVALADIEEASRKKEKKKPSATSPSTGSGDTSADSAAASAAPETAEPAAAAPSQPEAAVPESSEASRDEPAETSSGDDVKRA